MLDLNELALFVEVVRAGSFAEAGRRTRLPANTISRHIQQLEAHLGSRLMQRSTRKLALTAAGQTLFERCATAVGELWAAGDALAVDNQVPAGLVRVAAPAGFFDTFSMAWIAQFLAEYPKVRLEFMLSDERADLISENIDLAFRSDPLGDSNVVARKMVPNHFSLVASPAYIAERGMPVSLRDLARHDCLTLASRPGAALWRIDGPRGQSEVRVSGRFGASTAGAVLQAAVAGLGIAFLPGMVTAADVEAGRLVNVLPELRRDGAGLYAVLPSRRQVPLAVSTFVDFVASKMLLPPRSPAARSKGKA